MIANFPTCLAFVLAQEGGWSDDPSDPGGATQKGITLRTLQSFRHGATVEDLKNISDALVSMIYRRQYWAIMGCDNLPGGVDLMVFNFGTNAGPARSVMYLQVIAGVKQDGRDGAMTEAAIGKTPPTTVITKLAGLQRAHYRADPGFERFGDGWLAREDRAVAAAIQLIGHPLK